MLYFQESVPRCVIMLSRDNTMSPNEGDCANYHAQNVVNYLHN